MSRFNQLSTFASTNLTIFAILRQRKRTFKRQEHMKSLLTLLAFCLALASFGQADFDERLLAKYSEKRIKELQEKQPAILEYWTYYLDHSYSIIDGEATGKFLITDQELKIKNLKEINILDLEVFMDRNLTKYYSIKGTSQYLALKSNNQFVREFSRTRKSKK